MNLSITALAYKVETLCEYLEERNYPLSQILEITSRDPYLRSLYESVVKGAQIHQFCAQYPQLVRRAYGLGVSLQPQVNKVYLDIVNFLSAYGRMPVKHGTTTNLEHYLACHYQRFSTGVGFSPAQMAHLKQLQKTTPKPKVERAVMKTWVDPTVVSNLLGTREVKYRRLIDQLVTFAEQCEVSKMWKENPALDRRKYGLFSGLYFEGLFCEVDREKLRKLGYRC